jgi:anti-anti-sigma regulatory factor
VSELRFDYRVTRSGTTKLAITGTVEPHRCRILREGVEMATALRAKGPVVIDLAGVDRLAGAALLILRSAADQAARSGRRISVLNLRQEALSDTRGELLHRALWPDRGTAGGQGRSGQDGARRRSSVT